MAEQLVAMEDSLTCPICLQTFKEPLTLDCHHNFCSDCLQGFWDQRPTMDCPTCRAISTEEAIVVNFALKQPCIPAGGKPQSNVISAACPSHPQAETELKQQLKSQLQSLKKSREQAQTLEQAYREYQQHAHAQAQLCENTITAQFERLHCFLKDEEELRLFELRLEQNSKVQRLDRELATVTHRLASLQKHIQQLEKQLQKNTEDLCHSPAQSHTEPTQPLPSLGPNLLIDQAKVLGNLGIRVWRKMRSVVKFSPVVLDPNTAHSKLQVSEDMSCVKRAEEMKLPENPERFREGLCVLGSEGFRSGTHHWDVEVGDYPCWVIGVMNESVNRRETPAWTPENGLWTIGFYNNEYLSSHETLDIKQRPQRIRVQLDYVKGTVSFHESSDMSHIFTFKDKFIEKLFPFFLCWTFE